MVNDMALALSHRMLSFSGTWGCFSRVALIISGINGTTRSDMARPVIIRPRHISTIEEGRRWEGPRKKRERAVEIRARR